MIEAFLYWALGLFGGLLRCFGFVFGFGFSLVYNYDLNPGMEAVVNSPTVSILVSSKYLYI